MLIFADELFLSSNLATNPKKLADGIGVNAADLDTTQGDFRGRRAATTAHTLTGYGAQQAAIYRMGRETASDTQYWLAYAADVDFARSLLASDPNERTYGTGGDFTVPVYTDNTLITTPPYGTVGWVLGIPAPTAGTAAAVGVAGSGATETRTYTQTFVRYNDDEGPPCTTPVSISCPGGSTINLTGLPAGPGSGTGTAGVTKRRIYVSTGGDYKLVLEQAVGTTTASDTGTRGAILQTGGSTTKPDWLEPPSNMRGLIELWSGMHGAFVDKAYMTCVPYNPHAWPVQFKRQVPDRIVGSAKWEQSWLLATTGTPRVAFGTTPLAMVDAPIPLRQGCVAKRSVVGVGHGVCWASNDGLCYHGRLGTYVMTQSLMTKAQWRALLPDTIIGAAWGDWYIGFYNDGTRKSFMVNTRKPDGLIWLTQGAYAVFSDPLSETLYLLDTGNVIKKWDAGSQVSATFKSRVKRTTRETNPGAARIIATTYPVTFNLWGDGTLRAGPYTITSDDPFRLPGGYMAEEWQYQIQGAGPVEGVFIGEELGDLP